MLTEAMGSLRRPSARSPPAPDGNPRLAAKMANFKSAVEGNKKQIEREGADRERRHEVFETCAAAVGEAEREEAAQRFHAREQKVVRAKCRVWTTDDFEPVQVLGQGAFGVVHLARLRGTEEYLALKQMAKSRYGKKNLRERAYAERKILAEARNRWFVELKATFHDDENLYMAMEFLPGGDLLTYLEKKQRFTEEETSFYMAELLEALDVVHKHEFVHRDVKPDNVVLTAEGHLKLLDFGLCKPDPAAASLPPVAPGRGSALTRRQQLQSQMGTPQYMAPEAYKGQVGPAGDIWAVGVMTFECLYGGVPFHAGLKEGAEAISIVADQVQSYADLLPKRIGKAKAKGLLGPEAERFLRGVLCDHKSRLSTEACRQEPFFRGLDFSRLHLMRPPIVPTVQGPADTSNFLDYGKKALPPAMKGSKKDAPLEWAHYEFDREKHELQRPEAVSELFESIQSL